VFPLSAFPSTTEEVRAHEDVIIMDTIIQIKSIDKKTLLSDIIPSPIAIVLTSQVRFYMGKASEMYLSVDNVWVHYLNKLPIYSNRSNTSDTVNSTIACSFGL